MRMHNIPINNNEYYRNDNNYDNKRYNRGASPSLIHHRVNRLRSTRSPGTGNANSFIKTAHPVFPTSYIRSVHTRTYAMV